MVRVLAVLSLSVTLGSASLHGFVVSFSNADVTSTPVYSNVTTFDFSFDVSGGFTTGSYSDPALSNIQYSVSGGLVPGTPSGFPGFAFALNHIFPLSPPIIGDQFYALNPSAPAGGTLRFDILPTANLSDGLQVDELAVLPASYGVDVVFHFDGREEGTGRYHPAIIQLYANGTGLIQNSNNMGGVNPATMQVVDVEVGEEYITTFSFSPATFTIATPEPGSTTLLLGGALLLISRRRRS